MKKMNKKGFTITELVIVIAVIAILAGVMIPTFSGIVETAQESAEMQKVTAAYKEAYALALTDDGSITADDFDTTKEAEGSAVVYEGITVSGYTFNLDDDGKTWEVDHTNSFGYKYENGAWTVHKVSFTNENKCKDCGTAKK